VPRDAEYGDDLRDVVEEVLVRRRELAEVLEREARLALAAAHLHALQGLLGRDVEVDDDVGFAHEV